MENYLVSYLDRSKYACLNGNCNHSGLVKEIEARLVYNGRTNDTSDGNGLVTDVADTG